MAKAFASETAVKNANLGVQGERVLRVDLGSLDDMKAD
jgi:hypothetical protein